MGKVCLVFMPTSSGVLASVDSSEDCGPKLVFWAEEASVKT